MEGPHPIRLRRELPATLLTSLLLLLVSGAADGLAGQRVRADVESITRRIQHISPTSGPPGTVVEISSGLMPHITPVRIGIGAMRAGFEALAELLTSPMGEFSVNVTVPPWVTPERNHRFIVFDFYFAPIALSEPFLVTDEEGMLQREGWITDEGEGCLAMRDTDDELFTLVGDLGALKEGDHVVVRGSVADSSTCAQGPTLRAVEIRVSPTGS